MKSNFWKTFFSLFGITILTLILIIGTLILYFSWQLRYGDTNTVRDIYNTYETKFSSISDTRHALDHIDDYNNLIRSFNPTWGNPAAPITIIAFMDFECPYSQAQFEIFNYVRTNYEPAVHIVFKQLPLTSIHAHALEAAHASTCAQEQNKFWQYHDNLFISRQLDNNGLYATAQQTELNTTLFNTCLISHKYTKNIEQDLQDAISINLRGTPTYIINGDIIEGSIPQKDWDKLILSYLNK